MAPADMQPTTISFKRKPAIGVFIVLMIPLLSFATFVERAHRPPDFPCANVA